MRPIRPATLFLSCALLAACADRTPVAPVPASPAGPTSPATQRMECTARVETRTLACGTASGSLRASIYGGQGIFVRLTTTAASFDSATGTFSATETVQNLLPYALGVHEGVAADSAGVKVFFQSLPTATVGSGSVAVQNPDGVGAFTATGQPFFKYAQVLAPQQVSAAKTWLFHVEPGVSVFSFSVYVSAAQQPSAFRIVAPRPNDTIPPDSIAVEVIGSAPPATSLVRAGFNYVGRPSVLLTYAGNGRWTGKVSTAGLTTDRLQPFRIVAVAPADSLAQTFSLINPNHRPLLTVTDPWPGTVVRDTIAGLRVVGTCATSATGNPCTVTARIGSGPAVSATGPSFDFTVEPPHPTGVRPFLSVTATDSHGLSATPVQRELWVEASATWHEVASAGTHIEAGSPGFIFYSDSVGVPGANALRLRDLAAGTEVTVLPDLVRSSVANAHITPTGVVFTLGGDSLMEYRNGVLSHLGMVMRAPWVLSMDGGWVAWIAPSSTLYARNTVTGVTTTIATGADMPDVAANGDVVFVQGVVVKRYRAGVITPIAQGFYPQTDGNLVVYFDDDVYLYDGSGSTRLSSGVYYKYPSFAVRNGWVFYNSAGASGGWQLFSRAPDGTTRPVSTEGPEPDLEIPTGMQSILTVGDNGEVLYEDTYNRNVSPRPIYAASPYSVRADVGGSHFGYEFFGSTLYVPLGRSFYQVVP